MSTRRLSSYPNWELAGFRLPEGPARANVWYWFCRVNLRWILASLFRTRVFERRYEPTRGPVVYICNHQSFLDPLLMSFALRRPMNFMARDSLFPIPVLGPLLRAVCAFPVRRDSADIGALKEAMRRIRAEGQVVMFPEGTRTTDGRIGPFLPGVAFLAQRGKATTVPVVIEGAFECWPRTQPFPNTGGQIVTQYGRPYTSDQARSMSAQVFVDRVRCDMIEIQADIRRRLGRPALQYDEPRSPEAP